MLPIKSFKRKLVIAMISVTSLICLIWMLAIFAAVHYTEDHLVNNQLKREEASLTELYAASFAEQAPSVDKMQHWLHAAQLHMPKGMSLLLITEQNRSRLAFLQSGEPYEDEDRNLHILLTELKPFWVLVQFDVTLISDVDTIEPVLKTALSILSVILVVLGSFVAYALASRLASPLENLTRALQSSNPPRRFDEEKREDEVGALARSFAAMLSRLNAFLVREQQFTRHASHEMRTPVAIIANCLSVLKLSHISEEKRERNIKRIEEAIAGINELIDTFLILGREGREGFLYEWLEFDLLLQDSLDKLIKDNEPPKQIVIDKPKVYADSRLLGILLDNLVKNAIQHGTDNFSIELDDKGIMFSNAVDPNNISPDGYGYGLEIVERVVKKLGWQCDVMAKENEYQVKVSFVSQ